MEQVPGIDGKDLYNFVHILVWYEPVGYHYWGLEDSGRRNVKTRGKDKYRFTVVLTI